MSEREDRVDFHMQSRLLQRKCVFKWTLNDFSKYENGKVVNSLPFYLDQDRFGFTVYVCRKNNKMNSYIKRHSSAADVWIKYTVTITDGKDKVWYTSKGSFNYNSSCDIDIVDYKICCRDESNNAGETVVILLVLEMDEIKTQESYRLSTPEEFTLDVQKSLSQDMASLLENQMATDVTLRVEDDSVGAHKSILSARSPVFAKMFQQDTKESHNDVVDIQDLETATVKELLAFIYSKARQDYDFATALAVYYAADKYEVMKLREICASVLVSRLDKDNAGCVLKLADRHDDKEMKKKTLSFINFNLKSCIKSNWWNEIMSERSGLTSELETFIAEAH